MTSAQRASRRAAAVAAFVLIADQITKQLVRNSIALGERRHVLPGVNLVRDENSGIAFSLFQGSEVAVIVAAALVVTVVLALFVRHRDLRLLWLPCGLIVGGALGNLLDRLREGAVTDFIKLPHWPAFNVADASITVGVLGLVWIVGRGGTAARPA
jgi:signal peptidase II